MNNKIIYAFLIILPLIAYGEGKRISKEAMNSGEYKVPDMPNFPRNYEEVMITLAPYYQENRPIDYFFELYIVDVLDQLPLYTKNALSEFSHKHPTFFKSTNGNWQNYVKQSLQLSETIDIAIWDLWIRNSQVAERDGWVYHPWHYAQNFSDNYFIEGSKVDIWLGDSLQEAKKRILAYQNRS